MKREIYIYLGTVIFFILAIAIGIVMYMLTRTTIKQQDNISKISQEEKQTEIEAQPETENVSTEIGKTVDEAQKEETNKANTTNTNTTPNTPK